MDGVVISRQVEPGQTVAASLNTPTLFTIAQDLSQMQVDAIDESDIGRIRQRVSFTVDAFPPAHIRGTLQQIRKAAQNVQNVVTYTVVVGTSNPSLTLLPGMTANARVVTDQRNDVLKVRTRRCAGVRRYRRGEGRQPRAGIGERRRGRGLQAQRQRLVEELKLDGAQVARLDEIYGDAHAHGRTARPAGIRSPSTPNACEVRQRINAMLNAEQQLRYAELVASDTGRGGSIGLGSRSSGGGRPAGSALRTGLSDGNATEIASGPIKEGDEVIVGTVQSGAPSAPGAGAPRPSSARRCLSRPVIW